MRVLQFVLNDENGTNMLQKGGRKFQLQADEKQLQNRTERKISYRTCDEKNNNKYTNSLTNCKTERY